MPRHREKRDGRIIIHWGVEKASEETIARRAAKLESEGFSDAEVVVLKNKLLYGHWVADNEGIERWAGGVENLRRRRKTKVRRLSRDLGISMKAAAKKFKQQADAEVRKWEDEDKTGLPPEYDPLSLMGYVRHA